MQIEIEIRRHRRRRRRCVNNRRMCTVLLYIKMHVGTCIILIGSSSSAGRGYVVGGFCLCSMEGRSRMCGVCTRLGRMTSLENGSSAGSEIARLERWRLGFSTNRNRIGQFGGHDDLHRLRVRDFRTRATGLRSGLCQSCRSEWIGVAWQQA